MLTSSKLPIAAVASNGRPHLVTLDALRGFAAVCVVLFHLGQWLDMPILAANSALAVDLFFCLSGYVLPRAYRHRRETLSTLGFLRLRLERLMPLIVLATLVSALYVVFRAHHVGGDVGTPLAQAVAFGILDIPYLHAPSAIAGPQVFPLNGPQYTLLLELLANVFWWWGRRFDQTRFATAMAVLGLVPLALIGLGGDVPATFWHGFPRVGVSFFIGILIFQYEHRIPRWRGETVLFWLAAAGMAGLFFWPRHATTALDMVWIASISPALVLLGSRVALPRRLVPIGAVGGAISFPLYCLHYPLFCWVNGPYRSLFGAKTFAVEGPIVLVVALAVSYAVYRLYDLPLQRAFLAHRRRPARVWAPPAAVPTA